VRKKGGRNGPPLPRKVESSNATPDYGTGNAKGIGRAEKRRLESRGGKLGEAVTRLPQRKKILVVGSVSTKGGGEEIGSDHVGL